jgi:hypothetical protein
MSFLNPALLFGAAAVAVPILIHLWNRRRFRPMPWAAMRFLRASVEQNRRRVRIEDWLLLLVRCLLLMLLALALARPALRSVAAFLDTGRAATVLVLDHSASLAASDGVRTRMDDARDAAEAVVGAYPAGSEWVVWGSGDQVTEWVPEFTPDASRVRKELRDARVTGLATDHAVALVRAMDVAREHPALRKEVVLVTDRQSWAWRNRAEIASAAGSAGRDVRVRVVTVGEPVDDNLALTGLVRAPGFVSPQEPLRLQAEVVNRGRQAVSAVRVTLHLDGGPAVDEAVLDSLAPGEARSVTFFTRLPEAGWHGLTARLPADRQPADDSRTLVVRAVDRLRILVVDGDEASNAGFFLRHALQPVPAEQVAEYPLQPRVIRPSQWNSVRWDELEAVILADVPELPPEVVEALDRRVREGMALWIFAGPQSKPEFYSRGLVEGPGWLPAALGERRGDPEGDEAWSLAGGPYEHPVLSLWNEVGSASLTAVRFRSVWTLQPAEGAGERTAAGVVLRFADGSPAVVERAVGRGRVWMMGSTAGTAWNDLAVRPVFVPLLHRSLASMIDTPESGGNLRTGSPASLRLGAEWTGRDATVTGPEDGGMARTWTRLLRAVPGGSLLEFDETLWSGLYRVGVVGGPGRSGLVAAQMDPAESDLTEWTAAEREEVEGWAQVVDWEAGMDLGAVFDRERVGVELWLPLMGLVMGLALVETWLAQRFSRSK